MNKVERQFSYLVGVGIERFVLERHVVEASNQANAYYAAMKFMHPDKGYDYITVIKRLTKAEAAKYER